MPIALNAQGDRLAAVGPDRGVQVYDLSKESNPVVLGHHRDTIRSLCFNPSGSLLASASHDCFVKLWDVSGKDDPIILAGHKNWILCVTFSPDGSLVATSSADQTVRLWEARTGQSLMVIQPDLHRLNCMAFSPDGSKLAVSGFAGRDGGRGIVELYQLTRRQEKRVLAGHDRFITALAFHPTKQLLASGSGNNHVMFWDLQTGQARQLKWKETQATPMTHLGFSPDGEVLAVGEGKFDDGRESMDYSIDLRDAETGAL